VDSGAVRALARTASDFCARHVAPMVAAEGRDGDLERLGVLIDEAEAVGLMATPDPDSQGHEYGVWGTACLDEGSRASLAMLEEVATVCAGVAGCLHASGLGALEMAGSELRPRRVAVALLGDGWRFLEAGRDRPSEHAATIRDRQGGVADVGTKAFVHAVPGWDGCVVYGAGEVGWQRAFVRRDDAGVEVVPAARTMGLAAVETFELTFAGAAVRREHRLTPGSPRSYLTRHLLGLAAVAVGNARGAVAAAREYAEQRFQGGDQIEGHAAVQALIGDALSRVEAGAAFLQRAAEEDVGSAVALSVAAAAKLRCTVDCCQAVTDSLQVFGGYGYMEDYRLEKRLRDAITLKSMSPAPGALRRMVAGTDFGGGR
jgi:alkylation response protein AidB-like acyl-CoA dehydrogenase